ncbi:MAG: hypothetical protein P1V81_02995 [Planctomycetota bacterium]|nr:hypothetical protein [Planctomycetota bacterium]
MIRPILTPSLLLLAAAPAFATTSGTQSWLTEHGDKLVRTDADGRRAAVARPGVADRTAGLTGGAQGALVAQGWTPLGPFGGDADDVAASPTNPNVVLCGLAPATSNGTLFRSADGGLNWGEVSDLAGLDVHDLEFTAAGVAYAGTIDGLWRSTDDGASWTNLPLGIGLNDQVFEVTLNPADPNELWVGVADALGSQTQNVLRSTDAGATWTNRTPAGAAGLGGRGIALDPATPGKVVAVFGGGFGGGAAWRSLDSGATWTDISAGLPGNPLNDVVFSGGHLLVCGGKLFGSQDVGLFDSTNDGTTWTAVHDGTWPNLVVNDIEVDPASASIIYLGTAGAGVYRSLDGGATWTFGLGGTGSLSVNEVHVSGGLPVYTASSSAAIWKSTDGLTFGASSGGIGALNVEGVAVNPLDASEIAGAFQGLNDGGVYTTTDGGQTWSLEALPGTRFNDAGFAPDGKLFAISDGPTTIATEGLWKRNGASWSSIGPDQGTKFESELFCLDFGVGDADHILAGGSDFGVAGAEVTLWTTTDGGANWTKTFEGTDNRDVRDVRFLNDGSNTTALGAFSDLGSLQVGGVLRSTDGGASWSPSSAGLDAGVQGYGLGLVGHDPQTVYLADNDFGAGGVFKSTDGGASWSAAGLVGMTLEVAADPLHPGRLYLGGSQAPRVQRSLDDGATAAVFDTGLPASYFVRDMEVLEGACTTLLLATSVGIYVEEPSCRLEVDALEVSLSAGGSQAMSVSAGPAFAGQFFWVVGSSSGTSPGLVLDGQVLPLNPDSWMVSTLNLANGPLMPGTVGPLDGNGQSFAPALVVPPGSIPALAGTTLHHAAAIFDIFSGGLVTRTTNAQPLTLVP